MKNDEPLILYSAKFYYKIANFLLKPGTPNGQQKNRKKKMDNRLRNKKIVQNNK